MDPVTTIPTANMTWYDEYMVADYVVIQQNYYSVQANAVHKLKIKTN